MRDSSRRWLLAQTSRRTSQIDSVDFPLADLLSYARDCGKKNPGVYTYLFKKIVVQWCCPKKRRARDHNSTTKESRYLLAVPELCSTICKDVPRTFPEINIEDGEGRLFRVLCAIAYFIPEIGYTQGLSNVVAVLLIAGFSDEEAFWGTTVLLNDYKLRAMFLPGLPGVKRANERFNCLFETLLPKLYTHFEKEAVDVGMFGTNWFMILFSNTLPFECVLCVWKHFLKEEWPIVWAAGLALLRLNRGYLKKSPFSEILQKIQTMGKDVKTKEFEKKNAPLFKESERARTTGKNILGVRDVVISSGQLKRNGY